MASQNQTQPNSKHGKIYVLSIGINKYKNPAINNLYACVNDVRQLKGFLQTQFSIPDQQYKVVVNEDANRDNIIRTFRTHFSDLKDGDIALFHYSGHGSWENTSRAFVAGGIEPAGGRNELIVCHDSGDPNVLDIADKEWRMLISELQFPVNEQPKNIHFVCLLDCCHSGSMIRQADDPFRIRMISKRKGPRHLNAYLEGQYASMENIMLPPANYISLSACAPQESAIEDQKGGLFTNALIRVLNKMLNRGELPSYSALLSVVREITKRSTKNIQHPCIEYTGKVNPFNAFLLQDDTISNQYPQLIYKNEKWRVEMGAIHGVHFDHIKNLNVPIFEKAQSKSPIAFARIERVGVEETTVNISKSDSLLLDTESIYYVALIGAQIPVKITYQNHHAALGRRLRGELEKLKNKNQFFLSNSAYYDLRIDDDQLRISYTGNGQTELIYGIQQVDNRAIQHILEQMSMIKKWEQICAIHSPVNPSIHPNDLDLQFCYEDYDGKMHTTCFSKHDECCRVALSFDKKKGGIPYSFKIKNNTPHKLYYYLIHLTSKYAIYQKNENYLKAFYFGESIELYNSANNNSGLGIDDQRHNIQDTFLLIASRSKLSVPNVFEQTGFGDCFGQVMGSVEEWQKQSSKRGKGEVPLINHVRADWAVKRVEVKISLS